MKKQVHLMVLALSLGIMVLTASCDKKQTVGQQTTETTVSIDSLNADWINAWNNRDSASVVNQFADDAVLLAADWKVMGKDSLAKNWIHPQIHIVNKLTSEIVKKETGSTIAYVSGTYIMEYQTKENTLVQEKGNYTFIWGKQADLTWKLEMMHIEVYK